MTVWELIQELTSYNPNAQIRFSANFNQIVTVDIQGNSVNIDVAFDDYLEFDEIKHYRGDDTEIAIKLNY